MSASSALVSRPSACRASRIFRSVRSSEVVPEMQEYERTETTVVNSYVRPEVARYVTNLQAALEERMGAVQLAILRSGKPALFVYGPYRWARVSMRYEADGRSVVIVSDVSEERRREDELERALAAAESLRAEAEAATQAKSRLAAPKRRMPETSGASAA